MTGRSRSDAELALRASSYLVTDRVLPTQAAAYRTLLASSPTGEPLRDWAHGLTRADVASLAAGDLRRDRLPDEVRAALARLERQLTVASHRWPEGILATALAMTS